MANRQVVVVKSPKSVGISLLLTFLFGPLGLLYSTILGALVMMVLTGFVGFVTLGTLHWLTWPVCMVWGVLAVKSHNRRLYAEASGQVYTDF